jgi:hypothetical protein
MRPVSGEFEAQVMKVSIGQRLVDDLFNDGEKVVKGSDRTEGRSIRLAADAADRGQEKRRFNG